MWFPHPMFPLWTVMAPVTLFFHTLQNRYGAEFYKLPINLMITILWQSTFSQSSQNRFEQVLKRVISFLQKVFKYLPYSWTNGFLFRVLIQKVHTRSVKIEKKETLCVKLHSTDGLHWWIFNIRYYRSIAWLFTFTMHT